MTKRILILSIIFSFFCGCQKEKTEGVFSCGKFSFDYEYPFEWSYIDSKLVSFNHLQENMDICVGVSDQVIKNINTQKKDNLTIKFIPAKFYNIEKSYSPFPENIDEWDEFDVYSVLSLCLLKLTPASECMAEDVIWGKKYSGCCYSPVEIYEGFDLKKLALFIGASYWDDNPSFYLLNPNNGDIINRYEFRTSQAPPSFWDIVCSENCQFVAAEQAPHGLSLPCGINIYSLDESKNALVDYHTILLEQIAEDENHIEKMKIMNGVLIVSLSNGRRNHIFPREKIVFFDLKEKRVIASINKRDLDSIYGFGITEDHNYIFLCLKRGKKIVLKIYKRYGI